MICHLLPQRGGDRGIEPPTIEIDRETDETIEVKGAGIVTRTRGVYVDPPGHREEGLRGLLLRLDAALPEEVQGDLLPVDHHGTVIQVHLRRPRGAEMNTIAIMFENAKCLKNNSLHEVEICNNHRPRFLRS